MTGAWVLTESANGGRCTLCGGWFKQLWSYITGLTTTHQVCVECAEKA